MTTEHVSVNGRELAQLAAYLREHGQSGRKLPNWNTCDSAANTIDQILSRATPSDELQGAFAECYISTNGLETLRTPGAGLATVGRVKTDYSHIPLFLQPRPSAPRVLTAEDVERANFAYIEHINSDPEPQHADTQFEAMRAALATLPHAAIPSGYVVVPVEPTDDMSMAGGTAFDFAARHSDSDDACAIYKAMLAAAQQAEKKG